MQWEEHKIAEECLIHCALAERSRALRREAIVFNVVNNASKHCISQLRAENLLLEDRPDVPESANANLNNYMRNEDKEPELWGQFQDDFLRFLKLVINQRIAETYLNNSARLNEYKRTLFDPYTEHVLCSVVLSEELYLTYVKHQ